MERLEYTAPSSLDDALEALHANPGARPLAGGHSLILDLKSRVRRVPLLVDLGRLAELRGVRRRPRGELEIGSMTTITELVADPLVRQSHVHGLLSDAAATLPDAQVRNRGTIGGAVLAGTDVAAALIVLDAETHIRSRDGRHRRISVEDLLDPATPGLAPDEVITAVGVSAATASGAHERQPEPATLTSLCGVAVSVTFRADGAIDTCKVAVCGGRTPARRLPALERAMTAIPERATGLPLDDVFESDDVASGEYRAHLALVLAKRAVARARDRAI
ncbi:FAD binding domain-containing protein [Streptosporangium soli]|nr:FAD binding domain-containing protein [Streptosporangium sp. KLBMP 9127]